MTTPLPDNELELTQDQQTFFSEEELLYEDSKAPELPAEKLPLDQPQNRKKWIILGSVLSVLVLSLILLVIFNSKETIAPPEVLPSATPFVQKKPDHPINQRINQLELELKKADPARQDIVYPSTNFEIFLDEKE